MNFDDTPQEAEFRTTARKWIEANAPKQYEAELSKSSLGRIRLEKEEIVDVGKAWQKKKAEGVTHRFFRASLLAMVGYASLTHPTIPLTLFPWSGSC